MTIEELWNIAHTKKEKIKLIFNEKENKWYYKDLNKEGKKNEQIH